MTNARLLGGALNGRRVIAALAVSAMLSGCGGVQSALNPSAAPIQQNAKPAQFPPLSIFFDVYSPSQKIYLNSETLPPLGQGGCPWVTYYPTLINELAPGIYMFPPGAPDIVVYVTSCSPFNMPAVWSFSFGANLSNPTTICSGSASNTGQVQLNLSVQNTPDTHCTFQVTTVDGVPLALFTYNESSPKEQRKR
jgi:hypothetical protein